MRLDFKKFMEIRVANVAMQHSDSPERDIGRNANWLIACLIEKHKGWTMKHTEIMSTEDTEGTDGWFNDGDYAGKSVQIIRRIATQAQDDFAIKIVARLDDIESILDRPLEELIQQHGSKLSAKAEVHIMLTPDDDAIFIATIEEIRKQVANTIERMKTNPRFNGQFSHSRQSFQDVNGINLRIARGQAGYSVLAYVPARLVAQVTIPVGPQDIVDCERATTKPTGPSRPKAIDSTYWAYIVAAQAGEAVEFPIPNNKKKLNSFMKYVFKKEGLEAEVDENKKTVRLKKAA